LKTPSICFHNGQNGGRGLNLFSHSPPLDVIKKNVSFFSFIPWYVMSFVKWGRVAEKQGVPHHVVEI